MGSKFAREEENEESADNGSPFHATKRIYKNKEEENGPTSQKFTTWYDFTKPNKSKT